MSAASRRSAQQQPTPERYKEIQQALSEKGYFEGPVDGVWGPESTEALKHFQRDQNLTDDGKIGSLSLIALGLGPQRTAPAAAPSPAVPAASEPSPAPEQQASPPPSEPQPQTPPAQE